MPRSIDMRIVPSQNVRAAAENPSTSPSRAPLALPPALQHLSSEQQQRLQARQQQESALAQLSQQQAMAMMKIFGKVIHFIAVQALCSLAFSVLLLMKLGEGKDISWFHVFLPMFISSVIHVGSTLRLLLSQWAMANEKQLTIPQISHVLSGIAKFVFYVLLYLKVSGSANAPKSFMSGIFLPAWIAIAASVIMHTVMTKCLNEAFFNMCALAMLGYKLDGDRMQWGVAFIPFWICLGALLLVSCCGTCYSLANIRDPIGQVGLFVLLCYVMPLLLTFTVFMSFLTERLDGTKEEDERSNVLILRVLVIYEVLRAIGILALVKVFDKLLVHHAHEHELLRMATAEQSMDSGEEQSEAVLARNRERLNESAKQVALVRKSSQFFTMVASQQLGLTITIAPAVDDAKVVSVKSDGEGGLELGEVGGKAGGVRAEGVGVGVGGGVTDTEAEAEAEASNRDGAGSSTATSALAESEGAKDGGDTVIHILDGEGDSSGSSAKGGHAQGPLSASTNDSGDSTSDDSGSGSSGGGGGDGGGEENTCTICMVSLRDAVIQPCGHGGFCYECGKVVLLGKGKCPLCREPIDEVLKIDPHKITTNEKGEQVVHCLMAAEVRV